MPILHRLAKHAEVGSDDALFAHLRLAELLVAKSPWRASIHARKVLSLHPGEDRAWAILGLSQALLGHYRFARVAYEGAARAAPQNPYYAHNLGHLIDVALDAPKDALPWLRRARELAPHHPDVLASLAHAHARLGDFAEARSLLAPLRSLIGKDRDRDRGATSSNGPDKSELARLIRWVDREAPPQLSPLTGATVPRKKATTPPPTPAPPPSEPGRRARRPRLTAKRTLEILARGLGHLPFSPKQISRAKSLARDVRAHPARRGVTLPDEVDPTALAAAIAYAIVYVDQVPLSAGEVGAPFRVSATRVRAAFEILRTGLDLIRGDVRYATAIL